MTSVGPLAGAGARWQPSPPGSDDPRPDLGGGDSFHRVRGRRYEVLLGTGAPRAAAGSSIRIERKDPAFESEVRAALDLIRSTAPGKAMLEVIDRSGKPVIIRKGAELDGRTDGNHEEDGYLREDGRRGPGTGATVFWNPAYEGPDEPGGPKFPASNVLIHELVHAFNMVTGTMADSDKCPPGTTEETCDLVPAEESQAVGLPFDHDDNPSTPDITPEQFYRKYGLPEVSENAILKALGRPLRTAY